MDKIYRNIGRFLIDLLLFGIMMSSAQKAMNLDFGWACVGYIALFSLGLCIYTDIHNNK